MCRSHLASLTRQARVKTTPSLHSWSPTSSDSPCSVCCVLKAVSSYNSSPTALRTETIDTNSNNERRSFIHNSGCHIHTKQQQQQRQKKGWKDLPPLFPFHTPPPDPLPQTTPTLALHTFNTTHRGTLLSLSLSPIAVLSLIHQVTFIWRRREREREERNKGGNEEGLRGRPASPLPLTSPGTAAPSSSSR